MINNHDIRLLFIHHTVLLTVAMWHQTIVNSWTSVAELLVLSQTFLICKTIQSDDYIKWVITKRLDGVAIFDCQSVQWHSGIWWLKTFIYAFGDIVVFLSKQWHYVDPTIALLFWFKEDFNMLSLKARAWRHRSGDGVSDITPLDSRSFWSCCRQWRWIIAARQKREREDLKEMGHQAWPNSAFL